MKAFETTPENVAHESYFYDLPGDQVAAVADRGELDPRFAEKWLSKIEAVFSDTIGTVVDTVATQGLSRALRSELSTCIIVQWLRTRGARESISESTVKTLQALVDEQVRVKFPDLRPDQHPQIEPIQDVLPALQVSRIFDADHVEVLAEAIRSHIWIVGFVRPPLYLYASDTPVVRKASASATVRGPVGFGSRGVEIAFPLTSRHLLVMYERSHFRVMEPYDGRAFEMTEKGVEAYNTLQVTNSHRQVYCDGRAFELAERGV